jgi:hypothetical protein
MLLIFYEQNGIYFRQQQKHRAILRNTRQPFQQAVFLKVVERSTLKYPHLIPT